MYSIFAHKRNAGEISLFPSKLCAKYLLSKNDLLINR